MIDQLERLRAAARADRVPSAATRRAHLDALRTLLTENRTEIASAIYADFGGRPAAETDLAEILPLLNAIRHSRRHLTRWMRPQKRPVALSFQPGRAEIHYAPLGVIGIISPWNYPALLAFGPLVDALAAGNRAMIKPSEHTPRFAELLGTLCAQHFPKDLVEVVTGDAAVGAEFAALPFDHLIFTGSTHVGRKIMAAAAQNLTPVTLELGGKSPAIIAPDYDVADAAKAIVTGKFLNAGQTCIAPDYVLCPRGRLPELVQALSRHIQKAYPDAAKNAHYTSLLHGPAKLLAAIEAAHVAGAEVLQPSGPASAACLTPTLVVNPPSDTPLMQEEIFGPVLPILPYNTLSDALSFVQERPHPLALYAFTRDGRTRERILAETTSGGVTVNGTLLHIAQNALPFGGVGPSGIGAYHGHEGFLRFSHARSVFRTHRYSPAAQIGAPYGALSRAVRRFMIG